MLPVPPQPHQVESTIPSTSPMAQPVRQCSVALTAVDQELFDMLMPGTIYPWGVCDKCCGSRVQLVAHDGPSAPDSFPWPSNTRSSSRCASDPRRASS